MRLRRILWNPCKEYTRTGRPDTPSEGVRTTYPDRSCTRRCAAICTQMCVAICTWLPSLHPAAAHFSPRMFTSGIQGPDGRYRCFNFSRWTYPDHLITAYPDGRAAILYSAAVFSWSFLIFATDILGYFEIFCFRYLLSKSPKSPCNPPIIGFLSY